MLDLDPPVRNGADFKEKLQNLQKHLDQVEGDSDLQEMPHLEPQLPVPIPHSAGRGTEPEQSPTNTQSSGKEDQDIEEIDVSVQSDRDDMATLHTCSTCNKAFSSKGHLALHNKIHLKEGQSSAHSSVDKSLDSNWKSGYYRPYRCDLCNKSYSTAKHRWGHVSVCHRGNPLVTCPICARVFSTCYNLGEHKRTKHGLDEKEVHNGDVNNIHDANSVTVQNSSVNKELFPGIDDTSISVKETQSRILHTCVYCLKVFETEMELEQHSLCHTLNPDNEGNCDISKNKEVGKKCETISKADLNISENNQEISLLKQTLLQNRVLPQAKYRKRSPSPEYRAEEVKFRKRLESSAETRNNSGNRRKSSKPRKIARNEDEDIDEEGNKHNISSHNICSNVSPLLSESQENRHTQDDADKEVDTTSINNAKPFICLLCEKCFSLRTSLSRHFHACHGIDLSEIMDVSQYQPSNVKKQDSTTKKSEEQKKTTVEEEVIEIDDDMVLTEPHSNSQAEFICEVCTREFGDRASLWLHLRYTHKEYAAYACGICLQICEDNTQLYQHWKSFHPPDHSSAEQRRYICQICGRQHDSRKKLLAHVNVHNLDNGAGGVYNPEMLVVLNTSFYNKLESQDENSTSSRYEPRQERDCASTRMVKEAPSFGCELCYKSFPTEDGLVKHKKGAHKLNSDPDMGGSTSTRGSYQLYFVCELCGSSHRSKSERWRHVFRAHNGESALTCDRQGCGKVFPTQTLKREHCTNHHRLQGATPNVCEICGKLWSTRVDFWKHLMGVHADCVPLTCGVCLKIFCTVPDLQTHVHSNHLPLTGGDFCCDICGRPYCNRSKLSRHRRIHLVADIGDSATSHCVGKPQSLHENVRGKSDHTTNSISPEVSSVGLSKKSEINITKATSKAHSVTLNSNPKPRKTAVIKPQPVLFCDACPDIIFESIAQLAEHRRNIHSLQPCDLCSKFYGRTTHLWKHVKRVHNNHPELTCPLCKRISASKAHLETHISLKHNAKATNNAPKASLQNANYTAGKIMKIPTLYPCQKCSKRFWKRYLLKKHQRHCLRTNKPKACDLCPRVFHTPSLLKEHQRVAHFPQHCELCPDVFYTSKVELLTHIREAHSGHPHLFCSIPSCLKALRSKSDLDSHQQQHKSFKYPPTCFLCGEVCDSKARLWTHLTSANHKAAIPLTCGVCFKYLPTTKELIEHIECLHPRALETPNTCRICAKTYSSIYKVMDHFTKCHSEYFACKECLKVFTSREELHSHNEKGHEKQPRNIENDGCKEMEIDVKMDHNTDLEHCDQFSCQFCNETFLTRTDLMKHSEAKHNVTEDEKLSFGFEDNSTQKRYYNCEKCTEIFNTPSDLTDHRKKSHPTLTSETNSCHCEQCNKYFTNKSSYWKHLNSPTHLMKLMQHKSESRSVTSEVGEHISQENAHLDTFVKRSVPFVYIPDSNLEENFTQNAKIEQSYTSVTESLFQKTESKVIEPESEQANTDGKQVSNISSNMKPNFQRSEARKVYSESPVSNLPCYCQLCGKEWPAHKHLWQHLIRNHKKEAAVTCGVCLEVCSDYHKLSSHLSSQHPHNFSGKGNCFTCRICGRYHNARSKLIQHATIHTVLGPEPHQQPQSNLHNCQTCFKSFTDSRTLEDHQKVHEVGHTDSDSVHNGSQGADLVEMETETDGMNHNASAIPNLGSERLYSCEICCKLFKNEILFLEHRQTHTGVSKSKTLPSVYGMKTLVPKIEKKNVYVCNVCASIFLTETALATHLESHHRPSTPSSVSNEHHSSGGVNQDAIDESKSELTCPTRHAAFDTSTLSSAHISRKIFTCSRCKKRSFTSYINLTKHYRFCHTKKNYPQTFQASIQSLKKRKRHSQAQSDDSIEDSRTSYQSSKNEQVSVKVRKSHFTETPYSKPDSEVHRSEYLKSVNNSGIKLDNLEKTADRHRCNEAISTIIDLSNEANGNHTESSSIPYYRSHHLTESFSKENEFRGGVSEKQIKSVHKVSNINSATNKVLVNVESQMEKFVGHLTLVSPKSSSNFESTGYDTRNYREDQSESDAKILSRTESKMNVPSVSESHRIDIEVTNSLPTIEQSNQSEAPEQSKTYRRSAVKSEIIAQAVSKYLIKTTPNLAHTQQDLSQGSVVHSDRHLKDDVTLKERTEIIND
ncbi:zinc finger protein Xfin-like isoform X2 [Periplaneta americana]|uniref:zinc finger protein Xfin-like isoform X2 n=1 Tax=Periplaneta americana TaxID=6978 RepID=UPI0037E97B46